jgi:hypothetical protein
MLEGGNSLSHSHTKGAITRLLKIKSLDIFYAHMDVSASLQPYTKYFMWYVHAAEV